MELLKIVYKEQEITLSILNGCCRCRLGFAYLHSNRVVHRDLKPANILVKIRTYGECLKLSDFGLSKVMPIVHEGGQTRLQNLRSQIFPVMYGAPEVIHGGCYYNIMADVFSFGCICYGMLEGCCEVVGDEKHFSAFVFIPEKGERISLGEALIWNNSLKIGITMTGQSERDELRKLTLDMLKIVPTERVTAAYVKERLKLLAAEFFHQSGSARPGITGTV